MAELISRQHLKALRGLDLTEVEKFSYKDFRAWHQKALDAANDMEIVWP